MAQLAVSVLGAAIGSVIPGVGTSAGWLVGSLIGGALFAKGSKTEGPRLGDLTVQSNTEGTAMPIVYGNGRIAGSLIWSTGIQEVKTKKKVGGKGMGGKSSNTPSTYRASFAVALADRSTTTPIQGIRKIWADGKLIYSASGTATAATIYSSRKKLSSIAIYPGSSTQAADPTIQALQGAADTPAFRYTAYIVFKEFQLADFANRVPNITAEVVTTGSGTAPYQVQVWTPNVVPIFGATFMDGVIEVQNVTQSGNTATFVFDRFNLGGALLSSEKKPLKLTSTNARVWRPIMGSSRLSYGEISGVGDGVGSVEMFHDGNYQDALTPYQNTRHAYTLNFGQCGNNVACVSGGYLFGIQGPMNLSFVGETGHLTRRKILSSGQIARSPEKVVSISHSATNNASLSVGDDGLLYLVRATTPNITVYDLDLNILTTYNYPGAYEKGPGVVVRDGLLMDWAIVGPQSKIRLFQLASTLVFIGEIDTVSQVTSEYAIHSTGGGMAIQRTGLYSMYPPVNPAAITLASVVTNLCARCGLTAGQIDVTALTDIVDFYAIGRHVSGRAGIEPLMQAYYFDAVESGGKIKFVRRGGASVATLTENDLGFGDGSSALVKTSRQQEYELPIQVNVQHMDINNDYQPGSQSARRLTSPSKVIVDLDFPMGFSSTKAAQIAEVLQLNSWTERTRYELRATRKHAHLEPTDIITLPSGDLARIVASDFSDSGTMRFDAVADAVAMYAPVAVGNDAVSNTPQDVPLGGPTLAHIMDLPALDTGGNLPGVYVAAAGYYSGWRGAELLVSDDGGTSYASVYAITNDAVLGYTTTALQTVAQPHQLDVYSAVTVQLLNSTYTLASITDAQVLAGGNLCAIRSGTDWEILQFGLATLVSAGTYTLTRLLRARFGTGALVSAHVAGDAFVLITTDELNFLARPQADVNVARLMKASTFGDTYADTPAQSFTSTGRSQQPLAPRHLDAGPNRITGDWDLAWVRRARLNFWWIDLADMALDEATEAYRVEILNYAGAVVRTIDITAAAATYTKAQQDTDFDGGQAALSWRVCQRSALIGNGQFETQTALAPTFGPPLNVLLSHLPVLLIYTWTSTTAADDVSLNNLDGTFVGVPTVNQSPTGFLADATTRFASVSAGIRASVAHNELHNFAGNMTIGVWAKWTASHSPEGHFAGKTTTLGLTQYQLTTPGTGQVKFWSRFGGVGESTFHAGGYNDGLWHFIVGVIRYTATGTHTMELWVDGILRASNATGATAAMDTNAVAFTAGASSTAANQFTGDLGSVMLFGQALTAAQILALYTNARTT